MTVLRGRGSFGVRSGAGRAGTAMETIVRPFETPSAAQQMLERMLAERPGESDHEARICIGGPSRFRILPGSGGGSTAPTQPRIDFPPDDPEEEEAIEEIVREVGKELQLVRVVNPEDEEAYVETKRRVWSRFQHPDGRVERWVFDNSDLGGEPVT